VPGALDAPPPRWSRRGALGLGLGLVAGVPLVAGCTPSPTVGPAPRTTTSSPGATPPPASPAPTPTVPAAANAEQALSARAAAILSGPRRSDLDARTRALLTFARDVHADHAVALAGGDPTARPTSAAPSPSAAPPDVAGQSLKGSLARLARQEAAQATAQRRAATAASGLAALLAGSLAVAAESFASALDAGTPPPVDRIRARRPAPLLTDVEAAQQLVAQLHAVVYGYQLAIGKLPYSSAARARGVGELAAARTQLDAQIAFLLSRKADVPPAEPAYVPPSPVTSPAEATRLVRGMQVRLEPYAGLALAAAGTPEARSTALALLRTTARRAASWGAPLRAWPGWPD
jgi:hypothetical protein